MSDMDDQLLEAAGPGFCEYCEHPHNQVVTVTGMAGWQGLQSVCLDCLADNVEVIVIRDNQFHIEH